MLTAVLNRVQEHILFKGLNWKTEEAVEKLKKYLWGLESVRILEDHLESTMAQIEKARQSLEHRIKQVRLPAPNFAELISHRRFLLNIWT